MQPQWQSFTRRIYMIYLNVAAIVLVFFLIWFWICEKQKNYGLVDIAWGLGMSVVALNLIFIYQPKLQATLSLGLVVVWGLRLGIYLAARNWNKPEDYRYVNLRKRWGNNYPRLKAFLNVFVLQGVLLYLMMFSSMRVTELNLEMNAWTLAIGVIIALSGLLFETIGDYQLKKFKQNPANKGKLMTQGLWSITRHPNYFGEVVFWWGVFIATLQGSGSWMGIISPILITLLINKVSGIPLLERKYKEREDYQAYAAKTPRFIPWIGTKEIAK